MAKLTIEEMVDSISNMTVLELSELVKAIEDKFGVSASAMVPMAAMPAGGGAAAEEKEEKTTFNVVLKEYPAKQKVKVIKVLREVNTNLSIKEAKELVEKVPSKIKEGIAKEDAEEIKKKFEAVQAVVVLE